MIFIQMLELALLRRCSMSAQIAQMPNDTSIQGAAHRSGLAAPVSNGGSGTSSDAQIVRISSVSAVVT